ARRLRLISLAVTEVKQKMVLLIEVVVDLAHFVVTVASTWHGSEIVTRVRRKVSDRARPSRREKGIGKRALRTGGKFSSGICDPRIGRFGRKPRQPEDVVLLFETEEKESPILNDWRANRKAVVLIAQFRSLRKLRARRKKW